MSEHSARALRDAIRLAGRTGASLLVLHAVRPLASFVPRGATLVDRDLEEEYFEKRRQAYDKFLQQFELGQVGWTRALELGSPEEVILERARGDRVDLIVMGSLGRSGGPRLVLGSVAVSVTRACPCSVLTVKEVDAFQAGLEPELEEIWRCFGRGRRALGEHRYEEAAEQFEVCISLNRLFTPAWDGLAEVHEQLGHPEAAADYRAAARRILKESGEWRR
jgi:nucleotide-binding universal stress UspA family protein